MEHTDNIATSSITVNATAEQVWEALTNPAMVKQYLFGTEMHTTWEVGSPIVYKGEWEGKAYEDHGTVLEVEPNKKLVTSYWSIAFGPETPENFKTVTYEITPNGDMATLTITQDNNKDEKEKEHSEGNWNTVLAKFKVVLEK